MTPKNKKLGMSKQANYLLVILLVVTILISGIAINYVYGDEDLNLEKIYYSVGEDVFIHILGEIEGKELFIIHNDQVYRYAGSIKTTTVFTPKEAGNYTLKLFDKADGSMSSYSFHVSDEIVELDPEDKINTSDFSVELTRDRIHSEGYVNIEKVSYNIGEGVFIQVSEEVESIEIIYDENSLQYLGDLGKGITFIPKYAGGYSIIATLVDGSFVEVQFQVISNVEVQGVLTPNQQAIKDALKIEKKNRENIDYNIQIFEEFGDFKDIEISLTSDTVDLVQKIRFNDLVVDGSNINLKIDKVDKNIPELKNKNLKKVYAIDPTDLEFVDAVVTSIARGNELYKCKEWNYTLEICEGTWIKLMDLVPGEEYSFILTPDDPAYAETGVASINTRKPIYYKDEIVEIIIVVLDTHGFLVENANVTLDITDPLNSTYSFSTMNNEIIETQEGIYEIGFANTTLYGNYSMVVHAIGNGVDNIMVSYFSVKPYYEFDILRDTPVTTDPWKGAFNSSVNIISNNYSGQFSFTEVLPTNFNVSDYGTAVKTGYNNSIELTWNSLNNNSIVSYRALPPLVTPDLYELGPSYVDYNGNIFYEARPWFLAIDPSPETLFIDSGQWYPTTGAAFSVAELIDLNTSGGLGLLLDANRVEDDFGGTIGNPTPVGVIDTVTQVHITVVWTDLGIDPGELSIQGRAGSSTGTLWCSGVDTGSSPTTLDCDAQYTFSGSDLNNLYVWIINTGRGNDDARITYLHVDVAYTEVNPPPYIILSSPANNEWKTTTTINFTYNVTTEDDFANCTLWTNETSWGPKELNKTGIINNSLNGIEETFSSDGNFLWNIKCSDSLGNAGFSPENRTIRIDTIDPTVTLILPPIGYYNDSSNPSLVKFNCSIYDAGWIKNISLYITDETNTSFAYSDTCTVSGYNDSCVWEKLLANGNYTWNCLGFDLTNHFDWADLNRSFIINSTFAAPVIGNVECQEEAVGWESCTGISFNDKLYAVRANCTDSDGFVQNVSFSLENIQDNYVYFNSTINSTTSHVDYYSVEYGGDWANSPEEAIGSPNNLVAWDVSNNNNELYTTNFSGLPQEGVINSIEMGLRANFSAPGIGNDELTLKYSLDDGGTWYNLDGTAYDGSYTANQSLNLRNEYYPISAALDWDNLANITLGVEGLEVGLPDNEIVGVDSIWLRIKSTINWWELDLVDTVINDSGDFILRITCIDNDPLVSTYSAEWSLPWGNLTSILVNPNSDTSVNRNQFFSFTSSVSCIGGECGNIEATLDPTNFISSNSDSVTTYSDGAHIIEDAGTFANTAVADCSGGTCTNANSWISGMNNLANGEPYDGEINSTLTFNISGIDASNIENLTIIWSGCWNGIEDETLNHCDGNNRPDFAGLGGNFIMFISNSTNVDNMTCVDNINNECGSNDVINVGTYSVDPVWGDAAGYNTFKYTITNFEEGYVENDLITINWRTFGTNIFGFDNNDDDIVLTIDYANLSIDWDYPIKSGAISTVVGDFPFYTTNPNPQNYTYQSCLQNMIAGDSCQTSWQVNATGYRDTIHEFYVIYNMTSNQAYVNDTETPHINITIIETISGPPNVTLESPADNNISSISTVMFNCSAIDTEDLYNMTLYGDFSGTWGPNETSSISGLSDNANFSIYLPDGNYTWNCLAYDTNDEFDWGDSNRTLIMDTTKPSINLSYPDNLDEFTTSSIQFNFTVYDNLDNILTCDLIINSAIVDPSFEVANNTMMSRNITDLAKGEYYWNVTCIDHAFQINTSETWWFNITDVAPNVTLVTPNNYSQQSTTIVLQYNATDNNDITNATLYIDGAHNQSNLTVVNGGINNFTVSGLTEGWHNWTVEVFDISDLTSKAPPRWFLIDYTEPSINLSFPPNTYQTNSSIILFNFTVIDNYDDWLLCNITIANSPVDLNFNAQNGTMTSRTINNLSDGVSYWNVTCQDNGSMSNTSETRWFNVSEPPTVQLNTPPEGYSQNSSYLVLNYTPSDNTGFGVCSLILNGQYNQSNSTPIINGGINNFTLPSLASGYYNWTVNCTDAFGLSGIAPETRNFTVDYLKPNIVLYMPQPNATIYGQDILFNFSVTDNLDLFLTCNFTLDGAVNISGIIAPNNTFINRTISDIDGLHWWNVTCWDDAGNLNISETRNFTSFMPPNITLVSPSLGDVYDDGLDMTFLYIVQDNDGLLNSTFIINGKINQTNSSGLDNGGFNFYYLNITNDGYYNWSINATDSNGVEGNSTTWWFVVDTTKPIVQMNNPSEGDTETWNNVTFNFTVSDNLDSDLLCNLTINGIDQFGEFNVASGDENIKYYVLPDGDYNWSVICIDHAYLTNDIISINFTIDAPPNATLNFPIDNYRTNDRNITFNYTPLDAFGFENCTLYYNGKENYTLFEIDPNEPNYFNLTLLPDGLHNWTVECTDENDFNKYKAPYENFIIDNAGPNIVLNSPDEGDSFNKNNITFNWTPTDFVGTTIYCNLTVEGKVNKTDIYNYSGMDFLSEVGLFPVGDHNWSVTCVDDLGNTNSTITQNFTINQPDLYMNTSRISFNNSNPNLNENLTIFANVSNIGGNPASDVLVEFWLGIPDAGTLLGNGTVDIGINGSIVFNTSWKIPEGYHTIWVVVDPNNVIGELSESNNNASINISILKSTINEPDNGDWFTSAGVDINFTLQDYRDNTINYTIFDNGIPSGVDGDANDNESTIDTVTLAEGEHNITVEAWDYIDRRKNSSMITIYVDLNDPVPIIHTPNNTWFNDTTPEINFSITDSLDNMLNYTVYINGSADTTGNVSSGTLVYYNLSAQTEGVYEIIIEAFDDSGRIANSTSIIIYIDLTKPSIDLTYPPFGYNTTERTLELNFTVSDFFDPNPICNLTFNNNVIYSGVAASAGTEYGTTVSGLNETTYYWNVTCQDNATNFNTSETYHFSVFIAPEIELLGPPHDTWNNSQNLVFFFNATDDTGLENCSLILNGKINDTKTTAELNNGGISNFTVNNIDSGYYNWSINCTDNTALNVEGNSTTRIIKVDNDLPSITLEYPPIELNYTSSNIELNFTVNDNLDNILECNLTLNGNVVRESFNANEGEEISTTIYGLNETTYYWNVTCVDEAYNINTSDTWHFFRWIGPIITQIVPEDNNWTQFENVTFFFNVTDDTGIENCSILIDGKINDTKQGSELVNGGISNFTVNYFNGSYQWNIECYDNTSQYMYSNTSTRTLYVDYTAPYPEILTASGTWFNVTNPLISFNITDNLDNLLNYTFYVDGTQNVIGSVNNHTPSSDNLAAVSEGTHQIRLEAFDEIGNIRNSTNITIYVDLTPPSINLTYPENNSNSSSVDVWLNFTAYDNMASVLICNLTLDNSVYNGSISAPIGVGRSTFAPDQAPGYHYWNVTCWDEAGNSNTSLTYSYFIDVPDFSIISADILFNTTTYTEDMNISINATIRNIGNGNAYNITVQFWNGDWENGTMIASNFTIPTLLAGTNATLNTTYVIAIGTTNIYVVVDPPLLSDGYITESNETNNWANRTFSVSSYEIVSGNITGLLGIYDITNMSVITWSISNYTDSNIFVVDSDSSIIWSQLQAISRNTTNSLQMDDFEEIDAAMSMTTNNDSINRTWTDNGTLRASSTWVIYGETINNVSITNSTNTSNFVTGILWDYSDQNNGEFNGTQDLVFITKANEDKIGSYGTYDFEIKVPARLREYIIPNTKHSVTFYAELK